jgi:hypothetical protein
VYYPQDVSINLPGQTGGVWSMKTDGTGYCEMMSEDPDQDGRGALMEGDVSQDGPLLAFTYDHVGEHRHVALGTVVVDDDGCPVVVSEEQLTEVAGSPLQGSDAWSPAIDPSGTLVAVSAGQVANPGLWIIPIDSPAEAWRVPVESLPTESSWIDGRTVVYQRYNGKRNEILTADTYDGQEVKIASHKRDSLMAPRARD